MASPQAMRRPEKPDGCLGTRSAMVGTPGSLLHQA